MEYWKSLKRSEKLTFIGAFVFVFAVILGVYATDGEVVGGTIRLLQAFEPEAQQSRNAAVNCQSAKNKNTPYCQERSAETESSWRGISRYQGGKSNAFTLHGR